MNGDPVWWGMENGVGEMLILVWDIEYVKCKVGFSHPCFKGAAEWL